MDPIHPAVHDTQEKIYDEHFATADARREVARDAGASKRVSPHQGSLASHTPAEFDLPEFDPTAVMARVE